MEAHEKGQNAMLRAPVDLIADDLGGQVDHFDVRQRVVVDGPVHLLVLSYSLHEVRFRLLRAHCSTQYNPVNLKEHILV